MNNTSLIHYQRLNPVTKTARGKYSCNSNKSISWRANKIVINLEIQDLAWPEGKKN